MGLVAKKVSPGAIHVPGEERTPSAPKLFVHEGARQSLERKLRAAFKGRAVVLSINDNRSSLVNHNVQSGVLYVRLHHMFLAAPPDIVDALVGYIVHRDKEAGAALDLFIAEHGIAILRKSHRIPLETEGDYHDLSDIYDQLNERYFGDSVHALIGWGRRTPRNRLPRKTISFGSYCVYENVIRVHPVLDKAWVPRYYVAAVVYHEMLHAMFPSDQTDERRSLHPPEFLEREKDFRWHNRAVEWERKNLGRLLRSY